MHISIRAGLAAGTREAPRIGVCHDLSDYGGLWSEIYWRGPVAQLFIVAGDLHHRG